MRAKVKCVVVFEGVDAVPDDAATFVWRDRTLEVDFAVGAICASECIGNRAIEGIGAALAVGCFDSLGCLRALFANMNAALGISATARAVRREAKRARRAP